MLQNEPVVAKFHFDTAGKELSEVLGDTRETLGRGAVVGGNTGDQATGSKQVEPGLGNIFPESCKFL